MSLAAVYPLTPAQQGILYHTLSTPGTGMYVEQYECRIRGRLDPGLFRQSWDTVIERHEMLRALVDWEGRDDPLLVVLDEISPEWQIEDWSNNPSSLDRWLEADRQRGFELDRAPLMRFGLFRLTDDEHLFVWTHHHVVLDGWSLGIVLDQVSATYAALAGGGTPELPPAPSFGAFVRWLQARDSGADRRFWSEYVADLHGTSEITLGRPGRDWAMSQAELRRRLGADLTARLEALAAENEVTLNAVFQAAWALTLDRHAAGDEVVFGITTAGRPPGLGGALETVGLMLNTLPRRIPLEPRLRVGEWLRSIHRAQVEMAAFEHASLADIQAQAGLAGGEALFRTLLVFENVPTAAGRGGDIEFAEPRYHQRSNYSLALLVMPGESAELMLLYDDRRFDPAEATGLIERVVITLESLTSARLVEDVEVLSDAERERVLFELAVGDEIPSRTGTVVDQIFAQIEQQPDRPAVRDPDTRMSYRQLGDRAEQIARRLAAAGVGRGDRVGVCGARSVGLIAAILGVLRVGAAYVPLDPAAPVERNRFILTDTGAKAVLSDGLAATDGLGPVTKLIPIDEPESDPPHSLNAPLPDPTDGAYVIYTSGSTGKPKGVPITHGNLEASNQARIEFYRSAPERFLLLSPVFFDSSVAGLFWTLTTGGELVLPGTGQERDVVGLRRLMSTAGITDLLALPAVYELLIDEPDATGLGSLRRAIVAGETCSLRLVELHRRAMPDTRLFNEYGPTEGTVWATAHEVAGNDEYRDVVPIGRPVPGMRVYLLDRRLRPVPEGVVGELFLSGPAIASGYLNRPEETRSAFLPFDVGRGQERLYRTGDLGRFRAGHLELVGRIDDQVKIRGHRIELQEIENVLASHAQVTEVIVVPDGEPARGLVAYCGVRGEIEASSLRDHVSRYLPAYMIPRQVVTMPALPRTPNGKVDTNALPGPRSATSSPPEPATHSERLLARLCSDLLEHEQVDLRLGFIDVGGSSLLAMKLLARLYQETGARIGPNVVLMNTLEQVAAALAVELGDEQASVPRRTLARPHAGFYELEDRRLFYVYHPAAVPGPVPAVLLCQPVGWEYMRAHRAMAGLARRLSLAGFPVMRFDYAGTGNSSAGAAGPSLALWEEDVEAVAGKLRELSGSSDLATVGLRLGANLAASAAAMMEANPLVLWDPVVDGSRFLATQERMHEELLWGFDIRTGRRNRSSRLGREIQGDELLGFPYPPALRAELRRLDLGNVILPEGTITIASDPAYLGAGPFAELVPDGGDWDSLASFGSALISSAIPARIEAIMRATVDARPQAVGHQ